MHYVRTIVRMLFSVFWSLKQRTCIDLWGDAQSEGVCIAFQDPFFDRTCGHLMTFLHSRTHSFNIFYYFCHVVFLNDTFLCHQIRQPYSVSCAEEKEANSWEIWRCRWISLRKWWSGVVLIEMWHQSFLWKATTIMWWIVQKNMPFLCTSTY